MTRRVIILLLVAIAIGCEGESADQTAATPAPPVDGTSRDRFPATGIVWSGHFGTSKTGMLCLMGSGFFRAPRSEQLGELVESWLSEHPQAIVQVIAHMEFDDSWPAHTFVWVEDGDDVLNLHLVEQGACQGGVMGVDPGCLVIPLAVYESNLERAFDAEWAALQSNAGIWAMKRYELERHQTLADHYQQQERWIEAVAEYRLTFEFEAERAGTWHRIGECLENAGKHEEALTAFDRAIARNPYTRTHLAKGRFLERTEGEEAAVAWFQGLMKPSPGKPEFHHYLGVFHLMAGRPGPAAEALTQCIEVFLKAEGLHFEAPDRLVQKGGRTDDTDAYWPLYQTLPAMARAQLDLGDDEHALRYATMGLAVVEQMTHRKRAELPREYPSPDVGCHLVRARVFLKRGEPELARTEFELAESIVTENDDTSAGNRLAIEQLRRELPGASSEAE